MSALLLSTLKWLSFLLRNAQILFECLKDTVYPGHSVFFSLASCHFCSLISVVKVSFSSCFLNTCSAPAPCIHAFFSLCFQSFIPCNCLAGFHLFSGLELEITCFWEVFLNHTSEFGALFLCSLGTHSFLFHRPNMHT